MKIPYVQFNEINLGPIARKPNNEDIMKFLELVFLVIIHCPQKEVFIRRIMELDERSQYYLMIFIKKTLGDGRDDIINDTELNKKEIEILRNEKNRFAEQIAEVQLELMKNKDLKDTLLKENEELKLIIVDLQSELSKSPTKIEAETEIYHRLEKKLAEKTHLLNNSQEILKETSKKYEKEISQLRDELDIAQSKICQTKQLEKTLESCKKKVEKMASMKKRLIDLKRNNENMQQLIIGHQCEIETYQQYKKSSNYYKEEYTKEKEKAENLTVALESKEKQLSKLNKIVLEMSDKILYQENRIHELEVPLDCSFVSDDSFNYLKVDNEAEMRRNNRFQASNFPVSGSETINKEIEKLKSSLVKKKTQLAMLKERIQMQNEEILSKNHYNHMLIAQLSSRNEAMADKLQILSENISNTEHDKQKYKQMEYELNNIKNYKDSLLSEIKNLYEEKDTIYKKYIQGREEIIFLNSKIYEKEFAVREIQLNLILVNERLKSYEKNEQTGKDYSEENLSDKLSKLEQSVKELRIENYELKLRIKEKQDRIEDILNEKAESINNLKFDHLEAIAKFKHESDWKAEQIIRQTEEALSQIQKEKDDLQARFNIQKKNNLLEWKKSMVLRDPSMLFTEEYNRLRLNIAELEKENEKLLRNNQELTICWKDSAKMLKSVSKSVGIETKRMQKMMKQK